VGQVLDAITPDVARWIGRQPMFFVATAPSGPDGHVNLSPKGLDSFRLLDDRTAVYLDLTGSGAETIAHVRENGRITIMFCAFAGKPRIVRLHGRGDVLRPGEPGFDELLALFPPVPGVRSLIGIRAERVSSSCGYAVPLMAFEGQRDTLLDWAERKGPDAIEDYWAEKNAVSIDGLPAVRR
jgi:hypothetical protein